ncbi:MAG: hypothetical protein U5R06_23945 [candidate division KSB1 bacterium]|nr:hypothetical protein [candidate division KSB1 bacterium]
MTDAPEPDVQREQRRILKAGWDRQLLELQDETGTWSQALYSPKWTSTFYTLLLLKRLGAGPEPALQKACRVLLDKGFYEKDGGINYWKTWKQGECCVIFRLTIPACTVCWNICSPCK